MTRTLAVLLVLVVVCAAGARARADGDSRAARKLKRSALAQYRDADFAGAAESFRAAYELEPDPELLYGLGQSLRLAGDCAGALAAYQEYLTKLIDEKQAAAAQEKIDICRAELPPEPKPAPAPRAAPAVRTLPPEVPRTSAARPAPGWYRDLIGGALLTGGVVSAAAGTWLVVDSRGALDAVDRAGTEEEFIAARSEAESARGRHTAGLVLLGAGGGLVAGAVVRYLIVRRDRRDDDVSPALSAAVTPDGAGVFVSGGF